MKRSSRGRRGRERSRARMRAEKCKRNCAFPGAISACIGTLSYDRRVSFREQAFGHALYPIHEAVLARGGSRSDHRAAIYACTLNYAARERITPSANNSSLLSLSLSLSLALFLLDSRGDKTANAISGTGIGRLAMRL